jgi:hypothetical protein
MVNFANMRQHIAAIRLDKRCTAYNLNTVGNGADSV